MSPDLIRRCWGIGELSPAKLFSAEGVSDREYERCRNGQCFLCRRAQSGRHFTFPTEDRSGFEFAQVRFRLALKYPKAETIHLVMDNLSSHFQKSLTDFYGPEMGKEIWNCFTVHYTALSTAAGSTKRRLKSGCSRGNAWARGASPISNTPPGGRAWNQRMNQSRIKIDWKFDRKAARRKFGYKRKSSKRSRT